MIVQDVVYYHLLLLLLLLLTFKLALRWPKPKQKSRRAKDRVSSNIKYSRLINYHVYYQVLIIIIIISN